MRACTLPVANKSSKWLSSDTSAVNICLKYLLIRKYAATFVANMSSYGLSSDNLIILL